MMTDNILEKGTRFFMTVGDDNVFLFIVDNIIHLGNTIHDEDSIKKQQIGLAEDFDNN